MRTRLHCDLSCVRVSVIISYVVTGALFRTCFNDEIVFKIRWVAAENINTSGEENWSQFHSASGGAIVVNQYHSASAGWEWKAKKKREKRLLKQNVNRGSGEVEEAQIEVTLKRFLVAIYCTWSR